MKRGAPLQRRTPMRRTSIKTGRQPLWHEAGATAIAAAATEFAALRRPDSPRGVIRMCLSFNPQPKEDAYRSEAHRKVVAGMRCLVCGISGFTQAAHMNLGKGMSIKADDRYCFPLCTTRPGAGVIGCHEHHDQPGQSAMVKALRRRQEAIYVLLTYETLRERGLWRVPLFTDEQVADLEAWAK